jgi:hypothetical protein
MTHTATKSSFWEFRKTKRRRGCAEKTLYTQSFSFILNFFTMKNIFFLFLTILTITSCGKKDFTSVEGHVFEKGSNKPVANAQVIFSRCVSGDGTGAAAVCTDIETVTTDANGKYVFTKEKDDADRYRIRAEKTNYGKPVEVFQTADAGKCTEDINFTLPAFAWIKFHVKNVNPFDDGDLIRAPGAIGGGHIIFTV